MNLKGMRNKAVTKWQLSDSTSVSFHMHSARKMEDLLTVLRREEIWSDCVMGQSFRKWKIFKMANGGLQNIMDVICTTKLNI